MTGSKVFGCSVAPEHAGFTRHPSHLCAVHRIAPQLTVELPDTSAAGLWGEFQAVFGERPELTAWKAIVDHMVTVLGDLIVGGAVAAGYRLIPTFDDDVDSAGRDRKAWNTREGIKVCLFPEFSFDAKAAYQVALNGKDRFGFTLDASSTLLGYGAATYWLVLKKLGIVPRVEDQDFPTDVAGYVETIGNHFISRKVDVSFGELLYLHSQVHAEVTGSNPANMERYADTLLSVPKAYVATEQLRLNEIAAAENARQQAANNAEQARSAEAQRVQTQAQAEAKRKADAARDRKKVGIAVVAGITGVFFGSKEERAKWEAAERKRTDEEYRRNRNYNAKKWAERNGR